MERKEKQGKPKQRQTKLVIASLVGLAPLASQEVKQEKASDRFARGARSARPPASQQRTKAPQERPKSAQERPQSSPKPPQTLQKPSQNLPKPSPNRSRIQLFFELALGTLISSPKDSQNTAKRRPRAPKRRPRASKTLPKWSPRPYKSDFKAIL